MFNSDNSMSDWEQCQKKLGFRDYFGYAVGNARAIFKVQA